MPASTQCSPPPATSTTTSACRSRCCACAQRHRCCAIELGMNHKGEIAYLAGIAAPTRGAGQQRAARAPRVHELGEEVAAENAAVYAALPADGVAVVNADDAHAGFFRGRAGKRRVVDFGLDAAAAVTGSYALKPLSSEMRVAHARRRGASDAGDPGPAQRAQRAGRGGVRLCSWHPMKDHRRGAERFPSLHRPPAGQAGDAAGRR